MIVKIDADFIKNLKNFIANNPINQTVLKVGDDYKYPCMLSIGNELLWEGSHDPSDWIIDKPATGVLFGRKHKECTSCGKVLEEMTYASDEYCEKYFAFYWNPNTNSYSIDAKEGVTLAGDVYIPGSYKDKPVTHIEPEAFKGCEYIEKITIAKNITHIGEKAFQLCSDLEYVVFEDGSQLENIGASAFGGCTSLQEVVIPDSVTSIGNSAFSSCFDLVSVVIGDGVETIGERAFQYCTSLIWVVIGSSVSSIGKDAFSSLYDLEKVYYNGTQAEWNKLLLWLYNTSLGAATKYYYSETYPTKSGNYWHWVDGQIVEWKECEDHIWQEATCTTPKTCTVCGKIEGGPLGHVWSEWKTIREPTENKDGLKERTCSRCGKVESILISSNGWEFMLLEDDTYSVKGASNLSGYVVIPSKHNGKVVTTIDASAFEGNRYITGAFVPDTITTIGDYAFAASSIVRIDLGKDVTTIDSFAFYGCEDLYAVDNNSDLFLRIGNTVPGYLTYYAKMLVGGNGGDTDIAYVSDEYIQHEDFLWRYWAGRRQIVAYIGTEETTTLPLTDMGGNSYELFQMRGVRDVTIPEGITSLAENAFSYCDTIVYLAIPSSVTSIGKNAFTGCSNLNIEVAEDNTAYYVENNCLYDSTGKIIFGNANSRISSTATEIGAGAFYGNTYSAPVKIPLSVTNIGSLAFGGEPVKVYVEAPSKPEGWADDWCDGSVTVVWGYTEDTSIYLITEDGAYLTDEQGRLLII